MTIFHYIIEQAKSSDIEQQPPFKQKRIDFMEHRFPVIQDATYNKHVYQQSKYYVEVGCLSKGDDVTEAKNKNENV